MLISRIVKRIILLFQGLAGLLVITVNGILLYQYLHRADCTKLRTQPQTSDDFVQATKNFGECVHRTVNDKGQPLEKKPLSDDSEPSTTISPSSQISPSVESSPFEQAFPESQPSPLEPTAPPSPVVPIEAAEPSKKVSPSPESSLSDSP